MLPHLEAGMIQVSRAGFAYGATEILRDIDFTVARGQLYGVLGPNGSGKTTLVRLLLGFLRPSAGRVLLGGRDVAELGPRELARTLALVPQEMPVDFPFTVGELVLLGRTPHLDRFGLERAQDLAAAEAALAACGIRALAERPIHALAGGELRRAYVARALAQSTPILVCDEPTAGLDIRHQIDVLELLRGRARAGATVLVVMHDLNLAAAYCDRLLLLRAGRAIKEGPVAEVLTPPLIEAAYDITVVAGRDDASGVAFWLPKALGGLAPRRDQPPE
jgi:iron complex transport system ATP-binding protein